MPSKPLPVAILGAGPCGLGAAFRLKELGMLDFEIFEASFHSGGLASSFVDEKGFTWDIGGHVQFSHYLDFDRVMDLALPNGWLTHQRESWVWIYDRFIPYPFQNNLWRLPENVRDRCVVGLEKVNAGKPGELKNFGDWIDQSFGAGIAEVFMRPYNLKVWAYPPEQMSAQWIGERVATVDLKRVKDNIEKKQDDISWGPNATFRFPQRGGTGAIWKSVAQIVGEDKIQYGRTLQSIDLNSKTLSFSSGEPVRYEKLLSTISLNALMKVAGLRMRSNLLSSNSHIVGIGLKGKVPEHLKTKCWIYFPENETPFYRVTVFSNYSPFNVPNANENWSLMCETSSSPQKKVNEAELIEETIRGLKAAKMIQASDEIVSQWAFTARPGYPTPTPDRDEIIADAFRQLATHDIFSRGRFGAWKYEVSNQDHTFMQGFEWADQYVSGREELTVFKPSLANAPGKRELR